MTDSVNAQFGPVELMVVALAGDEPSPEILEALTEQVDAGTVRVLDFLVVSKSAAGEVTTTEVEFDGANGAPLDIALPGLTGDDDIELLAENLPNGQTAAIVALELLWARALGARLAAEGGQVIAAERIPSAVVNELAALDD